METSVPNALRHLTRRKYSLSAALELGMEVRGTSHHRSVCWTLTPWGMEYRLLLPTEATGVGVLARFVRSAVTGADLCTVYGMAPRFFDNLTASWYLVNDTKWIAYDDQKSLEKKVNFDSDARLELCNSLRTVHELAAVSKWGRSQVEEGFV
ncbi:hypothetical protein V5799_007718 [Amblyomma americanum]|uniref:Uncharacterized protein n=1 Tax=Amblyomma americanum TaxID=6943 RepID=A0AAQ4FFF8_AMBAM